VAFLFLSCCDHSTSFSGFPIMTEMDVEENSKNPIFVSFGPSKASIVRIRPIFARSPIITLDILSPPNPGTKYFLCRIDAAVEHN
jgi:hypothetical protein